ncbi:MAG: hypothetical protein AABZ60_03335 [Planctomycetota bacterium]
MKFRMNSIKSLKNFSFIGFLGILALISLDDPNEEQPHRSPPQESFFLVMVDGVRYSEALGDDPAHQSIPHLWNELRSQGSILTEFYNTGPTYTCPGHLGMITGIWQSVPNDGSQRSIVPTLFEYYRKAYQLPKEQTVVFAQKTKLKVCTHSLSPEYGEAYQADFVPLKPNSEPLSEVLNYLKTYHPKLVLLSIAEPDLQGHENNWNGYLKAIQSSDQLIHQLWSFLQQDSIYQQKSYLFMSNDHGRHLDSIRDGFVSHGCPCTGCQHINFFAIGPRIQKGLISSKQGTLLDICKTVAFLLEIEAPYAGGRVLSEIVVH